ncbi:hypothetical protein QQS21_009218 [Conoideocrella luteorostrata]|uniref:Uncharacterized protein n=1 Tax=Conoideocrella luteorostrata TaxID=1105319 RepID=A0AAJ0CJQ0_9HYPO|nr:hypothetical protein QQS21_009218 [Conoideocrella luteorostrata]
MTRKISVTEISLHDRADDAWIVVDGQVYNMTDFAPSHPGGPEIIYQHAGKDASAPYNEVHAPSLIRSSLDPKHCMGALDSSTITESWTEASKASKVSGGNKGRATDSKPPLQDIISMYDFEAAARTTFTNKSWAYINGASNDNLTRDANIDVLKKIWLRPAVMRDVKNVTSKTTLFGCNLDLPFFVAPTGSARTAGEEGELALARAAGPSGTIHCISTSSSFPLAEILGATPHHAFFQLYVNHDRGKTEQLLHQITSCGKVKAIFVTADLAVVSKREDDERIKSENAVGGQASPSTDDKGSGLARQTGSYIDPSLSWDDVAWIREHTSLPLVIKGIQRWEDAQTAMRLGCQGIAISNHGGRAADTAQPSIITLLELHRNCPEVFECMDVLIDGGFRRGSDVVKAICLGASAVGLGRPFMYAVNYGQRGVEHAVNILRDEIETAMRLCGMTDLMRDAGPDFLNTSPVDHLVCRGPHPYIRRSIRPKARL